VINQYIISRGVYLLDKKYCFLLAISYIQLNLLLLIVQMSDKAPLPEQETNTPKEKSLAEKFLEDKRNAAMGNSGNKNPGSNKP